MAGMRGRKARATDDNPAPRALVASAKRIKMGEDFTKKAASGEGWEDAAWHFFDTCGEYAYAVNWVGNLLSRARLFATVDEGKGPKRVESGNEADSLVDQLFYNEQGRSQMLRQIGVHYTVPGQCYVVNTQKNGADIWQVVATSRIKASGGVWTMDGKPIESEAEGGPFVMRTWRPHPVRANKATSPSRAALPILSEIERLTMHVAAQVDSRLASAGILFLPKDMTFATDPSQAADGSQTSGSSADAFVKRLYEVMSTAIANRDDASALVPIVVTADGETLDKVQHMTFWSNLDEQAIALRTEAIRRLALSMDMPPEVLTGQGDTNHWAAWQIDESAIKSHTEPLLNQIAADLAEGYLRPLLIAGGMDPMEAQAYGIGVDTSEMRLRPNRSKEAMELWDRGELSTEAMLRETGFSEDDIPDDQERKAWLLRKIASGSASPEQVQAALTELGVILRIEAATVADQQVEQQDTRESRPSPSLEDHPTTGTPDDDRLAAAAEVMVFRVLERAGNRLKSKAQARFPGVPAEDLYRYYQCSTDTVGAILTDAWDKTAKFMGITEDQANYVAPVLDSYVRAIILEQKEHDPAMLRQYLTLLSGRL